MAGCAHAVSTGEEAFDCGHAVIDLAVFGVDLVFFRNPFFVGAGNPDAAATGMAAKKIGLGRHDFGTAFFWHGIAASPQVGLANTHVEEVFPGFRFKIFLLLFIHGCEGLVQGGLGVHIDGTTAIAHFLDHHVVAQTGRDDVALGIAARFVRFQKILVCRAIIFAFGVGCLGLEKQEPGAHRTITILEAGRDEAVFHHRHFGANLGAKRIGGTGIPYGIPCAAHAFAH